MGLALDQMAQDATGTYHQVLLVVVEVLLVLRSTYLQYSEGSHSV
jgi:hypothetical protein